MRAELIPDSSRLAGIVTAAELVEHGLTRAEIRVMTRSGILTPLRHGVYARAALAAGLDGRLLAIAAAVAMVGNCAASHQDAAVIHGLHLLKRPPPGVINVSRNRRFGSDAYRAGPPAVRVHSVPLPRSHLAVRNQIVVTSAARTVIDVARTTPFRDGVVTTDSALRQQSTTRDELGQVIAVMARWPGSSKARDVVEFADGGAESPFESIARVAFRDGGLPPPKLQQWISDGYSLIGRVDFLWPEYKTIAEADGAAKYADPANARLQLQRDTDLRDAGYEVVHFTWWELDRGPELVIGRIRAGFIRSAAIQAGMRPPGPTGR